MLDGDSSESASPFGGGGGGFKGLILPPSKSSSAVLCNCPQKWNSKLSSSSWLLDLLSCGFGSACFNSQREGIVDGELAEVVTLPSGEVLKVRVGLVGADALWKSESTDGDGIIITSISPQVVACRTCTNSLTRFQTAKADHVLIIAM